MSSDRPMQLGMVGLGRMGANLVRRLMRGGHRCVVYDVNAEAVKALEAEGRHRGVLAGGFRGQARQSHGQCLADAAGRRRGSDAGDLFPLLEPDDVVIDGGNSYYRDDIRRAPQLAVEGFTMSTSAPAAGSGAWSAATA